MKTIVYAHPWEGSYNHAILTAITKDLREKNQEFQVIDLYKDGFNPVYSAEELKLFSQGETTYPLVKEYQQQLNKTTELIFVFPIWWFDLPAILKGFIDKVMLFGFGYLEDEEGNLTGLLTHITKTTIVTTSTAEQNFLENEGGNAIQGVFINRTLADIGIKNDLTKWIHFSRVNLTTDEDRKQFLDEIAQKI
ncbi:NAD(P)H-dependent oxidoreductase [Exiguobacterium sp. 17-1]|uniref:NAD(P)H-dependent oxidoreductase n=1 Tax=Exiguobacterium sp. 17-1 TaxID=2931981 RepID=UPI0011CC74C8|nr:NAD(P)H-dependent oxidoreductase [Exiguobacterium sp. 17-1]MCK2157512.1 NAD(P)H-dependent oxidoreductase [Exiguobacterium sp. 17-1]